MKYIRKLFWFVMASAVLIMFTGYSRVPDKMAPVFKQLEEIKKLRKKNDQQILKNADMNLPKDAVEKAQPKYTYKEKHEEVDGKKYVFIRGKYYEYRADNVYMVDGVRTYFVNNEKAEVKPSSTDEINHEDPNLQASDAATEAEMGEEVALNIPKNAGEAMQKLKDYKAVVEARDKLLEALKTDGQ